VPWPNAEPGVFRGNTLLPVATAGTTAEKMQLYLSSAAGVRTSADACTPSGLYHMLGNVAEWTDSPLPRPTAAGIEPDFTRRLVAGHSWDAGRRGDGGQDLSGYLFADVDERDANYRTGFRCVIAAEP
jgi:formylglycine-generating enzyme required for sulfatase activity